MAIPGIMACLRDSVWGVREAAITGLSNIAACRMYYHLLPFGVPDHGYS